MARNWDAWASRETREKDARRDCVQRREALELLWICFKPAGSVRDACECARQMILTLVDVSYNAAHALYCRISHLFGDF